MKSSLYLGESLIVRWMRAFFRDRLTESGRMVFWLFLIATAVGMTSFIIKVYLVWCLLFGLSLTSMVAARLARVPLLVSMAVPERTTCGAQLKLPVKASNERRRRAVDVELRPLDLPAAIGCEPACQRFAEILPGETVTGFLQMTFSKRGHYLLPGLRQDTLFPFGWWRDILKHPQPASILVYPRFFPLEDLDIPIGRRYQPGGIALTSYLGDSTEFLSTREFREGDSIRSIHWRSWARLGKPIVKEFQEEYFCRIALLLDTFVEDAGEAPETFEAAVSTAAAVAESLSRNEYVIDIFAAGPELYHLQAGRSLAYLQNVLDILACIEPSRDPPFEKVEPVLLEFLENITTTVVVLLDWDERRERMLRVIRSRGSAVKAVLIRQEEPKQNLASAEDLSERGVIWIKPEDIRRGVERL